MKNKYKIDIFSPKQPSFRLKATLFIKKKFKYTKISNKDLLTMRKCVQTIKRLFVRIILKKQVKHGIIIMEGLIWK